MTINVPLAFAEGFMKKIKYGEWAVYPEIVDMLKVLKVATTI